MYITYSCSCTVSYAVRKYDGSGSELVHLDDVSCSGTESMLTECSHRGIGVYSCSLNEGAAVICSGENTKQCNTHAEMLRSSCRPHL